ncbi:uncharacterized protein LOC106141769 [Amyelois transitella]|uniref:uncharacterized protein LOC106141769 n=1 Tax=Amyelois transitella TaxID=680683 RepID=UPI00298FE527|nr:uncharacterized protein LOC106141769 [Amyelois transitella]
MFRGEMTYNYIWIFFLILRCFPVSPRSTHSLYDSPKILTTPQEYSAQKILNYDESTSLPNDKVISVRITSSIAVGGRKGKPLPPRKFETQLNTDDFVPPSAYTEISSTETTIFDENFSTVTDLPPHLRGANIEFIKQLNAKKDKQKYPIQYHGFQTEEKNETFEYLSETKPVYEIDSSKELSMENSDIESLPLYRNMNDDELFHKNSNYTDSIAEPSLKSVLTYDFEIRDDADIIPQARSIPLSFRNDRYINKEILLQDANIKNNKRNATLSEFIMAKPVSNITNKEDINQNVPLGRSISISPAPENYVEDLTNKPVSEGDISESLTTVSFNVLHNSPNTNNYKQPNVNSNLNPDNTAKFYEPPKIYSQPAQVYSEPAKFYSEPAKIYSEPAKIYSEPAKVYSEPAKIYSEPAKFYSPPASLHLPPVPADYRPWHQHSQSPEITSTSNTTPVTTGTRADLSNIKGNTEHQPEKNYEIDEKISVLSEGRIHGVQESTTEKCKEENCKVGYVVEGRQFKKYRVEERTSDGFIVGEYGVVRNEDGALRGVRYTADGDASPRLIYDALMKFLQLK